LDEGTIFAVLDRKDNVHQLEFTVNDKVKFLRNDKKGLGVMNGQVGYVKEVNGNSLVVRTNNRDVLVDFDSYRYLDHGYAMTAHKAQGDTVEQVLIQIDTKQRLLNSRNSYYVDLFDDKKDAQIVIGISTGKKKRFFDLCRQNRQNHFTIIRLGIQYYIENGNLN
jgi:hypothetical protein